MSRRHFYCAARQLARELHLKDTTAEMESLRARLKDRERRIRLARTLIYWGGGKDNQINDVLDLRRPLPKRRGTK